MSRGKTVKISFFGDSICSGQGVSLHKTWVSLCSSKLETKYPHISFVVNNSSINGNTTRMALERMPMSIQDHKLDVLVVQFGMNDCNYWKTDLGHPRVSPSAYKANLEEIIERAFCSGVKKVILHNNHTVPSIKKGGYANDSYQENNGRYCKIVRDIASGLDEVCFNDIELAWKSYLEDGKVSLKELLLEDNIHLSREGHELYFSIVYPQLEAVVESLV